MAASVHNWTPIVPCICKELQRAERRELSCAAHVRSRARAALRGGRAAVLDGAPRRRAEAPATIAKTYSAHARKALRAGRDLRKVEIDFHDAISNASANQRRASVHVCAIANCDDDASDAS